MSDVTRTDAIALFDLTRTDLIALLALIVAAAALVVSIFSARFARRSAHATERQAAAAEALLPAPVSWRLEQADGGFTYMLRNVGTDLATGVRVITPTGFKGRLTADVKMGTFPQARPSRSIARSHGARISASCPWPGTARMFRFPCHSRRQSSEKRAGLSPELTRRRRPSRR